MTRGGSRRGAVLFRAYVAVGAAALRSLIAYQMALVFGLVANTLGTLAIFYLWRSVLSNSSRAGGFDWPHMKAYLLIAFVAGSLVSSYTDYRLAGRVLNGDVVMDLVKPLDYQASRFAEAIGSAVYELCLAGVGVALAILVFGGVALPGPGEIALSVLSMLLVVPLRFGIIYATGLLTFWTKNYVGLQAGRTALVTFLSGALVPLAFFPGWLRIAAYALPFAGMAAIPGMIFVEQLRGTDAVLAVAGQAGWAVALWWLTKALWSRASRQLTVHGG